MKTVLRAAGVPCARHRLARSAAEAADSPEEVGFPLVVKPPAGAGAKARSASTTRRPEHLAGNGTAYPGPPRHDRGVPDRAGRLVRQRDGRRPARLGLDLGLPADAARGAAQPVDAVGRPAAPRHHGPEYDEHQARRPDRAASARAAHRAHPHGVVPPPRRLGRRVGGRRAAARRPDHLDAVLRARLRPVHGVGAAHGRRHLRPAGTPLVRGHRLPARPGRGQVKAHPRPGRAAARGERARRRLEAAAAGPAVLGQLRGRRLHHRPAPGHGRGHRARSRSWSPPCASNWADRDEAC